MNLAQKISAVMTDVQYLTKDDRVDTGAGKSYRAITEEKVTSVVRASMIKNGIVMFPTQMQSSIENETVHTAKGDRVNRITHVDVVYRMVNTEDPTDYIDIASCGTGVDTQDKGSGKAMTYAYKYALLRTFAIPTGDDPDKIASDVYTEKLYEDGIEVPKPDAGLIKAQILGLAKGDVDRVNAFISRCFPDSGLDLETLNVQQLEAIKVAIAKKLQQ
jgi:hypothetical protein